MEFKPTIGMEIHVELKTKTKMFCDCLNDLNEETPNKNICPICLAHPGALPTINKKAVSHVILAGLALGCDIAEYSRFDRKNYFYPDLPKGYQISQGDLPLCQGGYLPLFLSGDPLENQKTIQIKRIHLEEDTARLIHPLDKKSTLIDFNRAGVPLMELVTEPVIHTGREARFFAQGLQLVFKTLGISEADMEKGQMRCEVNISLGKNNVLGTKVEIKNLNSFRAVEKAIDYEIERQKEVLKQGEKVLQETRGWDAEKEITYSQRIKEEAEGYRYFPEPDLPLMHLYSKDNQVKAFDLAELKKQMPMMPWQKQERMKKQYGFAHEEIIVFLQDENLFNFFEQVVIELNKNNLKEIDKAINLAKNYLISDLKGLIETELIAWHQIKITPQSFAQLIIFLLEEKISSRTAKDILKDIIKNGGEPNKLIKDKGLEQVSGEDELVKIVLEIIEQHPAATEDYRQGKTNVIQFLVGQAMAKTKGAANPAILEKLFQEKLSN